MESMILRSVLATIGERPANYDGFQRAEVPSLTREQIDAAVEELYRGGYVVAAEIPASFGDNPRHWAPSVLTVPGRHLLEELSKL